MANFICIFFVSRQLVLLSALPKCLHSFFGQKECPTVLLKSFISIDAIF